MPLPKKKVQKIYKLTVWHDCSTIAGHSHFLVMVSAMYDPEVYHTNEEYQNLYSVNIDVQAIVENPYLYDWLDLPQMTRNLLTLKSSFITSFP